MEIHTKAKGITTSHAHVKARATGTRSSNSPVTKATAATSSSKVEVTGLPHNIPTTKNMCLPSSSPQTTLVLGQKLMAVKNLTEVIKTMHNGTLSSLRLKTSKKSLPDPCSSKWWLQEMSPSHKLFRGQLLKFSATDLRLLKQTQECRIHNLNRKVSL